MSAAAPMNTQCPRCRSIFRVSQEQLDAADGRVRCSQCRRVFNARTRLQKELPLDTEVPAGDPQPAGSGDRRPPGAPFQAPAAGEVSGVLLSDITTASSPAPSRSYRGVWGWAALNTLLLVGLCLQLVFIQRAAFAQDPALRPLVARMCDVAGCQLRARRAVDQLELVRRNVYAHPNVDDALIIDAKFINNADFPQPYPTLTISLGDIRGKPLIRRNFEPREYRPELGPNARIAPGAPVQISLEVRDPGREARTFEIEFS